ncbi:MAG: Hpt domain-containing protein [Clostridiales bacterium]|jgi:HPt (histidine-containing phosphotransfer) domain-containing protein|nr:Hpt domain-containing protein [Clostridiales bacterium]
MNISLLKTGGIDYEEGIGRFVGNSELYESLLKSFCEENDFDKAKAAVEAGDTRNLFELIHTMKGVTGNLSLTPLYRACCELTEKLRAEDYSDLKVHFDTVYKIYTETVRTISAATEESDL